MRQSAVLFFAYLLLGSCSDDSGPPSAIDTSTSLDGAANSCAPACGPNAICQQDLSCRCESGWLDCNNDVGQSGGDGCECSTSCNGALCGTGPQTCEPNQPRVCGDATRYCEGDTCKTCPSGSYNCDGVQDCESTTPCGQAACEPFGENTCGSQSKYCDEATSTCQSCPAGFYNCDQTGGDCECSAGCDGTTCQIECTFETGCGDTSLYCDFGSCVQCPAGKTNCNQSGDCECLGTCDGTTCLGDQTCDYYDNNVCGGDTSKWCNEGQCTPCTGGFFNCNNTRGCECDSAGCNGSSCAGECLGGECP